MVIGHLIKCSSCSQTIRVHFSLASYFPQTACFRCKNCCSDIKIGYNKAKNLFVEGASITDEDINAIDATVSPDKPLDVYSDLPATMQTVLLASRMGMQKMISFEEYEQKLETSKKYWEDSKTFFRILKEKGATEAERICTDNKESFLCKIENCSNDFLSGKWDISFQTFEQLLKKHLEQNNLDVLKQDILRQKDDWLEKIYNAFESYYENEEEFRKITLMQKCDNDSYSGKISCHWNKIKKVYADIYEVVCSMFVLPTAISNLENGRAWNNFQSPSFTWDKYIESDMDGRGKNFADNPNLNSLLIGHDNRLRNAPSHAASKFDFTKSEIIMNCGKGGKRTEIIPLVDYMKMTNELFAVFSCLSIKFIRFILL